MVQKIKQCWLLVFIASIAMVFAMPVFAKAKGNGYILKKGKEYPICLEMIEILNLPENAHSFILAGGKELTIPKKYKNFQTVEWTALTENELSAYMTPETEQLMEKVRKWYLSHEVDNGDKFIFEMAKMDFDRDDKALETLLRYRLPNWKQWNCMFADTEPESYRRALGPVPRDTKDSGFSLGSGNICTLFQYGGRIYKTSMSGFDVLKPITVKFDKKSKEGYDLGFETICQIWNTTNWERELKGNQK